jgi:2-methylcitrate dehydratase PrpD
MTIAQELAARIVKLDYDALPPAAVHWAKVGILDTVGVTLAGSREPTARIAADVAAPAGGPSLIFGTAQRTTALDAALVNGAASHALDFDDCNNTIGGHPSAPILPALFALADARGATGPTFVNAYVAGFEAETRIARGVHFHHYEKGWHPTATLGVFGSAAACARMLGLDAERTAVALAIAASFASGIKANFGTMVKPLHVGHCTRNGLFAALLAEGGYTANPGALEHKQGFLELFNGAGNYDASRILDLWADPLDIIRPGIAIKQYPCCGSTHPALDAMLELRRQHGLKADDVVKIEAWVHARRLAHTNRPAPNSDLDAKFSLQHCLVRALLDGKVEIGQFENAAYRAAAVQALLPKVHVAPYDASQFDMANHFGGEVRVTLRDGRVVTAKVQQPLGRTSDNPLPAERLKDKFDNCALRVLPPPTVARLYTLIQGFEKLQDVRDITAAMAPAPAARAVNA